MDDATRSENSRRLDIALDIMQSKLARHDPDSSDVGEGMTKLRQLDPLAEVTVRHLAERYFPGVRGIAQKEKAVRMMLTAFFLLHDTRTMMKRFDMNEYMAQLDNLPPTKHQLYGDSSGDGGAGSRPSAGPQPGSSSPRPRKR